jgi:hypothetical protein
MAEVHGGDLGDVAETAVAAIEKLSGFHAERISGARPGDDGDWSLLVDVVELTRVPDTTSVVATYRVDADRSGRLRSYERLRRFTRGAVDT